jgi:DNA-binding FadR family transcriptional regulator
MVFEHETVYILSDSFFTLINQKIRNPMRPVRQVSATAELKATLQALIETGNHRQSERLPSESELSRIYGVSRAVVREALMSLQALGLTESQAGKGTFVVSDRVRPPLLMGRYSSADIREVRRCLEIPSARFAAERRSDANIGELSAILTRLEDTEDPAKRNRLDAGFHIAIAAASGNPLIVKLVEDLRGVLEEYALALAQVPHRRKSAGTEHRRIYEAIVKRDPEEAAAAMEEHLIAAEQSFASIGKRSDKAP